MRLEESEVDIKDVRDYKSIYSKKKNQIKIETLTSIL